ncbi:hypothetical protein [Microcoleus asticus]|uniref:Uncharacterized protein n=1 Tax=Microcoleus asticus IPMA8 TaxID=2563858 RepID=A0ABX2D1T9_9CYAN|nr:hypothetical protein [Microcoleus asticus]NQE36612.1 hypothetical protein [Microcoleus asticus IPMA8]
MAVKKNLFLRPGLTGKNTGKKSFLSFDKKQKKPALQLPTITVMKEIRSPGRNGYRKCRVRQKPWIASSFLDVETEFFNENT